MQVSTLWHNDYLLSVSLSGAINYLNPATGTPKTIIQGHMKPVQGFAVDRKNGLVYTTDADGQITCWTVETGAGRWFEGVGHGKSIVSAALTCDNQYLVSAGLDDKLRFNETKSCSFSADGIALGGQPVAVAASIKDPTLVAVILANEKLLIIRAGKTVATVDLGFKPISLAFNSIDTEIAVGGQDQKVHLFKLEKDTATAGNVLGEHTGKIMSVRYSSDGKFLVSTDSNRNIFFWNDGKVLNNTGWPFHNSQVTATALPPSCSRIATCSLDQDIIIWSDLKNFESKLQKISLAHPTGVDHVEFLDENILISSGNDRTIKIWKLA